MQSDNPVVELPIAVETSLFRLSDQQVYVPISAKLSSSALDWAQKHGQHEASFDFAAQVSAVPSGEKVAQLRDTIQCASRRAALRASAPEQSGLSVWSRSCARRISPQIRGPGKRIEQNRHVRARYRRAATPARPHFSQLSFALNPACSGRKVLGGRNQGTRTSRQAPKLSPGNGRRKNRSERDSLLYAAANTLCFVSSLLS